MGGAARTPKQKPPSFPRLGRHLRRPARRNLVPNDDSLRASAPRTEKWKIDPQVVLDSEEEYPHRSAKRVKTPMSGRSKVHILALLQRQEPEIFLQIKTAYASQYSRNAAQYLALTLDDWSRGTTQITPENLDRIDHFHFPDLALPEKDRLVLMLYKRFRTKFPYYNSVTIVIDVNEEERIQELRDVVDTFSSEDFDVGLSYPDHDCGISWVCGDDPETAQSLLRQYTLPEGKRIFDTINWPAKKFIERFQYKVDSVPYSKSFECEGARINVYVRHKYFKKLRDATGNSIQAIRHPLKSIGHWWDKSALRPKSKVERNPPPYDTRKFRCPHCERVMVLTPQEYAKKRYTCPFCNTDGTVS